MKIDMVVPAYKADRFIEESVSSIMGQQHLPGGTSIRVIVVCDGCDDTYSVAKNLSSESVLVVMCNENSGAYKAINCGLSLARIDCDLIGTQGADDIMHSRRISQTLQMVKGFKNRTAAFNCKSNRIDKDGNVLRRLGLNPSNSGTYIYTSNVLKEIGMYKPWWCGADNEYRERFYRIGGRVHQVPRLLHSYRKHKDQLTSDPATARGTKERDFSYDEIERLKREGFDPLFQNHPVPAISEWSGLRLPTLGSFESYFSGKPLTT